MSREPVSVCIITLNEEKRLPHCLESVAWADEIVVVDSHSTDRTREIATEAGARVIEHDFHGYIRQKNFALSQATHEWVLSLDADEVLSPELKASLLAALESPGDRAGFRFNRLCFHLGRWRHRGGMYPDRKIRLFKRSVTRWGGNEPHDRAYVDGKVAWISGDLLHHSYDDLEAHGRQLVRFAHIAGRFMFDAGQKPRLHNLLLRPAIRFLKHYFWQRGFLDGGAGFSMAVSNAYYVFLKHAALWEMHSHARRERSQP